MEDEADRRGALDNRGFGRSGHGGVRELRQGSPSVQEALARGTLVSVTVRSGYDVSGYVCDRDVSGILVDVRDPSGDPNGYEFLPWSSIERVKISEQ